MHPGILSRLRIIPGRVDDEPFIVEFNDVPGMFGDVYRHKNATFNVVALEADDLCQQLVRLRVA